MFIHTTFITYCKFWWFVLIWYHILYDYIIYIYIYFCYVIFWHNRNVLLFQMEVKHKGITLYQCTIVPITKRKEIFMGFASWNHRGRSTTRQEASGGIKAVGLIHMEGFSTAVSLECKTRGLRAVWRLLDQSPVLGLLSIFSSDRMVGLPSTTLKAIALKSCRFAFKKNLDIGLADCLTVAELPSGKSPVPAINPKVTTPKSKIQT